jgi:5-methylcytosine-specific restriction endonuclease McrA
MPIRPDLAHHYEGPAWEATRKAILRRAKGRCECVGECGKHQGATCGRLDRSEYRNEKNKAVFVILTIAHLNHVAGDDRPENLRAWCQACHLRYDTEHHKQNAAQTNREKKNNLELFEEKAT